jgi:hypothetical protein
MEFQFDASEVPAAERSFELLPAGWYSATVTGAEVRATKTGTGSYLRVEFTVADPAGRKVWSNYNVRNQNSAAETIGRQQLAELLRAIGKPRLGDTDELLGSAVSIKVKVREAANGYDASNEVSGSKSLDGAAPPAPAAKAAAPAAAKAAPPWAKK